MIDFIKIKVVDSFIIKTLYNHKLLYFYSDSEVLLSDRETIVSKEIRQFENILFEFSNDVLYIKFRPHYFYNDNKHNANDFSIYDCIKVLKRFCNLFRVDVSKLYIVNIEFGVNILLPNNLIDVKDFLVCLIYHGKNEFYTDRKYPFCRFSHTINSRGVANVYKMIKCYAKGIQYPEYVDKNTLRFEVKSNRRRYINSLGIYTLIDLLDKNNYDVFSNAILKEFDELLIIDENAKPQLSNTKNQNLQKKLNPLFWNKLVYKSRNTFRLNFNSYYKNLDTCQSHLKKEIKTLIKSKLISLKSVQF